MEKAREKNNKKRKDIYDFNISLLQLGKIDTQFFSSRGEKRLKRIWLSNELDVEMIFSSWLGRSEVLFRQNVSDHVQAFLMNRAQIAPYATMLRRFDKFRYSIELSQALTVDKDKSPFYTMFVKQNLERKSEQRKQAEEARLAKSIAKGELRPLPGFEHVVKNPVFKAQKLENRLKKLSKIPMPCDEKAFEKHIIPIMTAIAISRERMRQRHSKSKSRSAQLAKNEVDESPKPKSDVHEGRTSSSGFSEPSRSDSDDFVGEDDSDLIQVFSEMDLHTDLNDTLADVCEFCGGLMNGEVSTGLECYCVTDPVWKTGKNQQTASALYEDGSKIVQLYLRENEICSEYMGKYEANSWLTKCQ